MPSQQEIERTVEEIAETVYLKIVTRAGIPVEHIAEALQAERQKRDQELQKARESERKIIKLRIDYDRRKGIPAEETVNDIYDSIELKDQSELDQLNK